MITFYLISVLNDGLTKVMFLAGMALAPWNVLASGKFRTDAEEEQRRATGEDGRKLFDPSWERTEVERKVSGLLEKVAKEVGTKSITAGQYAQQGSGRH